MGNLANAIEGHELSAEFEDSLASRRGSTPKNQVKAALAVLGMLVAGSPVLGDGISSTAAIKGGTFQSVLPPAPGIKSTLVNNFRMDRMPVTNAQFAAFVKANPEWQRGRAPAIFVDVNYLKHWGDSSVPSPSSAQQPVTYVSWFAANAYCESQGKRLPTWYEWEYVAAASEHKRDARSDPQWRQQILDWYAKSARHALPNVGQTTANLYGVYDMHGVVWEWVGDISAMLVSSDNRQQSDPDVMKYCGSAALTMEEKENYATLMRIAMLSSMQARYSSQTMGFRCASGD